MDGVVEFYNKIYSGNPKKWDVDYRDETAFYVLSKHTEQPETFLDIGCGNGHTIEYFSKLWPDTEYYGVDLSDVAIGFAKERIPEANFICASYEDADVPLCDVVILMGVAEHFEDLCDSLSDLKKYGKLIYIESPNCLGYSDNNEEGFRVTTKLVGANIYQCEWHLTRNTWEGSIRHAGLEIVQGYHGPTPETEFVWVLK
jgi:SAM-dependent methyltransferase